MGGHRDIAKKLLPNRFVDWYRLRRVNILEGAGGKTRITPRMVVRHGWNKTSPARTVVRNGVIRVTPEPVLTRSRRKRAMKRYMKALSFELLERETQLDYIEGRVAARRDGFYERMVREVLERTEMILQELDRRIEAVSARSGERMNALEEQMIALRDELSHLRPLQGPELQNVGARARAEVPEVPAAEVPAADEAEVQPAEAAQPSEDDAHTTTSDEEAGSDDDESLPAPAPTEPTANGAANGHLPVQAPAATAAE